MGVQAASAIAGVPVDFQSGCDESISLPGVPSGSETNETGHDGCCDSCCFCCCAHVLPEYALAANAIGASLAAPRSVFLYRPDQTIQPGLLPPRT